MKPQIIQFFLIKYFFLLFSFNCRFPFLFRDWLAMHSGVTVGYVSKVTNLQKTTKRPVSSQAGKEDRHTLSAALVRDKWCFDREFVCYLAGMKGESVICTRRSLKENSRYYFLLPVIKTWQWTLFVKVQIQKQLLLSNFLNLNNIKAGSSSRQKE